ncbi:MAG: phosphodiester glycosidase family protein [Verrucomicrobiales bacterium]|nr:phosphodiester glycosidase family protein [Verrucomicrobiales bacterium]
MRRRLVSILKIALISLLFAGMVAYLVVEYYFNVSSNAVLWSVRSSSAPLEVRMGDDAWVPLQGKARLDLNGALRERYREPGLVWRSLRVRRPARRLGQWAQKLFGAEVNVIEIKPEEFVFSTSFRPDFERTTARERLDSENLWFCVTANFQYPSGKPMGWVWHQGRLVHAEKLDWSGAFFVKNEKPWFGPKSLIDEVPGRIMEGSQVYPAVMKNHVVFPYVNATPERFFNGKEITYRSLAGVRRDGTVVFIASGDGGVMTVSEVSLLAQYLNVQHATLLDGGKALQYSIRTEDGPWDFKAYNTQLPFKSPELKPQISPVFIAVKKRPPPIVTERPAP